MRGLLRDEVAEPVGSSLGVDLIRELFKAAALSAQDLELPDDHD